MIFSKMFNKNHNLNIRWVILEFIAFGQTAAGTSIPGGSDND